MIASRLGLTVLLLVSVTACEGDESTPTPAPVVAEFDDLDFSTLSDDFPTAIGQIRDSQRWSSRKSARKDSFDAKKDPRQTLELQMTSAILEESFTAGSNFLVKWQVEDGHFRYMYDWITGEWIDDDHQVRQAAALWGLATCHRYKQAPATKAAIDKGLEFWFKQTIPGPVEGTLMMKYGDQPRIDAGSIALVALALIEYLQTPSDMDDARRAELDAKLDGYLAAIQFLQLENGHIARYYDNRKGKKATTSSPYYDGESLLALTKAARQLGKKELVPTIERAARAMAETYTVQAWGKVRDSNKTKGFYQWGSMSFVEYYKAEWKDHELFGDVALSLSWWMTHTHATLKRRRNHAYAIEGLISGWTIANLRGDIPAQTDLLFALDRSLYKLTKWQIGGPLHAKNKFLAARTIEDDMAMGGVMNARKQSKYPVRKDVAHQLRIDVTQHQMHAVTLALEDVYSGVE
jgi:UDP-N-acetylmuramoyl-tripeptide--D-alanyl-D-alanine ligase